jgi:hypothetical protein
MFSLVLIVNLLIGCICLFVAWQLLQVKAGLAQAAETLLSVEEAVHNCLHGAPNAINSGQMGVHQLRQNYQQLEIQWQRAQQVMELVSFGQMLWRQQQLANSRPPAGRRRQSSGTIAN